MIIDAFPSSYAIVPTSESKGARAYDLLKRYAKSNGLQAFDALIAASAIDEGLTLVTRNRRHFEMIDGLSLRIPVYTQD